MQMLTMMTRSMCANKMAALKQQVRACAEA
jgi:hypothetical protein